MLRSPFDSFELFCAFVLLGKDRRSGAKVAPPVDFLSSRRTRFMVSNLTDSPVIMLYTFHYLSFPDFLIIVSFSNSITPLTSRLLTIILRMKAHCITRAVCLKYICIHITDLSFSFVLIILSLNQGEEETTATATGTESDSGGRDSESEEEVDELYGEADDDEEMLANKVVDKFLAGPIARATSQSIQDLLVSGHVQMTRRQRYQNG